MKYYYISYKTYENYRCVTHTTYRTDKKSYEENVKWLQDLPGIYSLEYRQVEITQETLDDWKNRFYYTHHEKAPLFIKRNPREYEEWKAQRVFDPDYICFDNDYIYTAMRWKYDV